jgi:hypothetical protein
MRQGWINARGMYVERVASSEHDMKPASKAKGVFEVGVRIIAVGISWEDSLMKQRIEVTNASELNLEHKPLLACISY